MFLFFFFLEVSCFSWITKKPVQLYSYQNRAILPPAPSVLCVLPPYAEGNSRASCKDKLRTGFPQRPPLAIARLAHIQSYRRDALSLFFSLVSAVYLYILIYTVGYTELYLQLLSGMAQFSVAAYPLRGSQSCCSPRCICVSSPCTNDAVLSVYVDYIIEQNRQRNKQKEEGPSSFVFLGRLEHKKLEQHGLLFCYTRIACLYRGIVSVQGRCCTEVSLRTVNLYSSRIQPV